MTADLELAVVGAGPQALTILSYLAEYQPDTLQRTVVFDDSDWLTSWHGQFARFRIPMLRSACVHHPHPHAYGLIRFARERDRIGELCGAIGRPSTALFADYCAHLLGELGLQSLRRGERVADIIPGAGGGARVVTGSGSWVAARVVLATNPVRPSIPPWLGDAKARYRGEPGLEHSRDWGGPSPEPGNVVVVGGGLTAAQVVMAHVESGDHVTWLTRAPIRERDLDVEPRWLGPHLRHFHDTFDGHARVSMARRARGGGTVPPDERRHMGRLIADGAVTHLQVAVDHVRRGDNLWHVAVRHQGTVRTITGSRVVCATGSHTHVRMEPLLRRCRSERPARRVTGMPVLAADLSWPGTQVHVMGPLAMAAVGPASRTVIGARIAAERMVESWGAELKRQYPGPRRK